MKTQNLCSSRRLSRPPGLQHGQERHGSPPRGLCPGQGRPVRVGVSAAHAGPGREAQAQDRGRPPSTAVTSTHRALLRARVQPARGQDQRFAHKKLQYAIVSQT